MFWKQDAKIPFLQEFLVEGPAVDVERNRRVRMLEVGTLAMFVVAVAAAYHMWVLDIKPLLYALAITVIACGLNLVWLRLGAPVERIGNYSVGIFFALLLTSIGATGGISGPNFAWLYAIPICAALLIDIRSSCYWAGAVAVAILGFWLLAGVGIELPNIVPADQRHFQALVTRLSLLFGLMVFAMSFSSTQRRTERLLADGNGALELEAQCVRLLQHAAIAANESDDFDDAIDTCVVRVLQTTGWQIGLIWEPSADGSEDWICTDRVCMSDEVQADELIRVSLEARVKRGVRALGRLLETGQPVWASGAEFEPDRSPRGRAAIAAGLNSAVAIPVVVRGSVVRIVEFFGCESQAPDERLVEVLCDVGRQLGRVAERMRLQESVRRSQKLESVGQLAAGMAHEINNPMAYVRANLGMLRREWEEIKELTKQDFDPASLRTQVEDCDELILESLEGVDRTVAIVRDMREFTRDGGGELEWVALGELIESSLRVAASAKPADVRVVTELEPNVEIYCRPTRMRQVFLNLIVNAFHAVCEGGSVRIASRTAGDRVLIEIEDDGHGIDDPDRERIFEPFYTTKPAGQGTGLGLYISFEIVRWHGGTMEVESTPGEGSRFTLEFPMSPVTAISMGEGDSPDNGLSTGVHRTGH